MAQQKAQAVDRFLAAAFQPQLWPEALDEISRTLGADGATLVSGTTSVPTVAWAHSITNFADDYFNIRDVIDSREDRVRPTIAQGFCGDLDFYTSREINRDPFYVEFLKPRGFGWHAVAKLSDGGEPLHLSLKRRRSAGPFQQSELDSLGCTLAYLRGGAHAVQLGLSARFDGHLESLAALNRGGALVDARGRVLQHNSMLEFGDGLNLVGGRLRTAAPADQPGLDRILAVATSALRPSELPAPAPAFIRRPSKQRPLIVWAFSLWGLDQNPFACARAVVSVVDPAKTRPAAVAVLAEMYRLTPNEARLAVYLLSGKSVDEAAQELNITRGHARQRLKSIFQKTDTSRQGELIALLTRLG